MIGLKSEISLETYDKIEQKVINHKEEIEQILKEHANKWLLKNFDLELDIPLTVNEHLTQVAGTFCSFSSLMDNFSIPQYIEISSWVLVEFYLIGKEGNLDDTLRHELMHYALCELGVPYKDWDIEFQEYCEDFNIPLEVDGNIQKTYKYVCSNGHTHTTLLSKEVVNSIDYNCECGEPIQLEETLIVDTRGAFD